MTIELLYRVARFCETQRWGEREIESRRHGTPGRRATCARATASSPPGLARRGRGRRPGGRRSTRAVSMVRRLARRARRTPSRRTGRRRVVSRSRRSGTAAASRGPP
eukprot:1266640-Prymnesium_polylepis.1